MNYRDTINLPETDFPMRAGLAKKEPVLQARWDEMSLYALTRKARAAREKYVLHDGPPYPTGDLHVGTGLNKILKDMVVRYKTMRGYDAPFIPGWDCHGLPIEHKVLQELGPRAREMTTGEIRERCKAYALKYVEVQKQQFKRLGVQADWENPYLTLHPEYEAGVLDVFARMVERGFMYRSLKSTHWCMSCRTVLAEAELEYGDEHSPSMYVNFPLIDGVRDLYPGLGPDEDVHMLIWTTTPWTLPANMAIALAPRARYEAVRYDHPKTGRRVTSILARDLVDRVMAHVGAGNVERVGTAGGAQMEGRRYRHTFIERTCPIVLADYVSLEDGTGCVHTAPGHGHEDYYTGVKYGIEIVSPVDEAGVFTDEAGVFAGMSIAEGDEAIARKLDDLGVLLKVEDFVHSYPHCWRCRKPVIFRATDQWFVKVDHRGLRGAALEAVKDVRWIPSSGEARISSMIELRPDWCLSRQRVWGVPIPALYCSACGEAVLTAELVGKARDIFRGEGAESWFRHEAEYFKPDGLQCPECRGEAFEKETDIFDVWFEAGSSHRSVVQEREALRFPADLYLEGSDQHRGWFQLSLLPCVAGQDCAPFRTVLTHGFVVDEKSKKMSKSRGNFISVGDAIKEFPADILRLWTASLDYRRDINVSRGMIRRTSDSYRRIRNTFKYLLGNTHDFDPAAHGVPVDEMPEIDRWALDQLSRVIEQVTGAFDEFEFHRASSLIHNFCAVQMSAFYLDVLKDRLYTLGRKSRVRRSAQTVLREVLGALTRMLAPILVHTAEEVWSHTRDREDLPSVHLALWPEPRPEWRDDALAERWARMEKVRSDVLREIEVLRKKKTVGGSLEVSVTLGSEDEDLRQFLRTFERDLPTIFIVSEVTLLDGPVPKGTSGQDMPELSVRAEKCPHPKCARCWNHRPTVGDSAEHPEICDRCAAVLAAAQ